MIIKPNDTVYSETELIKHALSFCNEATLIADLKGNIVLINQTFCDVWGFKKDVVSGYRVQAIMDSIRGKLVSPPDLETLIYDAEQSSECSESKVLSLRDARYVECRIVHDRGQGVIWYCRDITDQYRQQELLQHQRYYDPLTDLPNHALLTKKLNATINEALTPRVALLLIDIDDFKTLNDSLGHDNGNRFLVEIARRLKSILHSNALLARLNGDEFVILMDVVTNGADIQNMIEDALREVQSPYRIGSHLIHKSASIGIAIYPNDGDTPDTLFRNAEIAMYKAKDKGRNCFHYYAPALERFALHRLALEAKLRAAVRDDLFELYYQPKMNIPDNRLLGFEALLRWYDEKQGFIGPDVFIPLAETTGLILPIGSWVLKEACRQIKHWCDLGYTDFSVAVNFSAKQLQQNDIYQFIVSVIEEYGVEPRYLEIEITESMVMHNVDRAGSLLRQLRSYGIRVSMDDFGTGYSSLNYLKSLPIDVIKIDRSFIKDVPESRSDCAVVSSIITMSKNLGLAVVAEGVETQEHIDFLLENSCDVAQGYYFSKPVPASEAEISLKGFLNEQPGA